jgi:hypothetical protein
MSRRCVLLLLGLVLGCTPELEPIRWEQVDVDALREAIANPTGLVDERNTDEVAGTIVQREAPYRVLSSYLQAVFAGAQPDRAAPVWVVPQALDGTSVYVLVACPGPRDAEAAPFRYGSMRIDSPTLDDDVISTLGIRGQLRLSFAACEVDDFTFEGIAPAFHDSDPQEFGFVPNLEVMRSDAPGSIYQLREPIFWGAADRISALFELSSGETLVLDWYAGGSALRLRGRNGELNCAVADQSLECVPP